MKTFAEVQPGVPRAFSFQIRQGVIGLLPGSDLKMQLWRIDASGSADCRDFFAANNFLPLFDQNFFIMGIGGDPAVFMLDQNQIAETFKFVAGISDGSRVSGFDSRAFGCFDVDTVIVAAFADGAELRDDGSFDRPGEFCLAVFGGRRISRFGLAALLACGALDAGLGGGCGGYGCCRRAAADRTGKQEALPDFEVKGGAQIVCSAKRGHTDVVAFGNIVKGVAFLHHVVTGGRHAQNPADS